MRTRYAVALVAFGALLLFGCGGSAPETPTAVTTFTFEPDPAPPVVKKITVLRPSDGGTVPLGSNTATLRLEFTFTGSTFRVQVFVSPDESGSNWIPAGAPLIDATRGVDEVPFGLGGSQAVTTRRVKVESLVEFYEINWK